MEHKLDLVGKNQVLGVLAVGGTPKMAAECVGCTERAIYYAARRDPEFRKDMLRNKNGSKLVCLRTMNQAANDPKSWRAAYYLLRQLYPDYYARRADTLPMKDVETVLMEVADIVNSTVADDKAREEIFRRVGRIFRSPRENLTPRRRKRQIREG